MALWAGSGWAAVQINIRQIDGSGLQLSGLQVRLGQAPGSKAALRVQLQIAELSIAALGWKKVRIQVDGLLSRDQAGRWIFDAPVRVHGAPGGAFATLTRLACRIDADSAEITLTRQHTRIVAKLPLDEPLHVLWRLQSVPVRWLQGVLASALSQPKVTAGTVSGMVAMDSDARRLRLSGRARLRALTLSASAGKVATEKLSLAGDFRIVRDAAATHFNFEGSLRGGQILAGSFYAKLPTADTVLRLQGTQYPGGKLNLAHFEYRDSGALVVQGSLALNAQQQLRTLQVQRVEANLGVVLQRYASGWLAQLGLSGLQAAGLVSGHLRWSAGRLQDFTVDLKNIDLADARNRFAVAGLHGGLRWAKHLATPPTTLGWKAASVYRLPLGASKLQLASRSGWLILEQPTSIPLLGGRFGISRLQWRPDAGEGTHMEASLNFRNIDLATLAGALGWPAFRGQLGGAVPELLWRGDQIVLNGGLSANLFDGFVDVTHLQLAHPFGDAPELGANLLLRGVRLGPMTSVFDFGEIRGRLDGTVKGLRLVAWKPLAFNAELHTVGGGRISQRAVKNLTKIGGGGLAGGLQATILKLFSSFSYRRIGISCKLVGSVCTMGGISPADGGGYTIVQGSGLPYIHIVGHQRRVDWPTLVRRLRAATRGQSPIIR